jgi:hypothetical protein
VAVFVPGQFRFRVSMIVYAMIARVVVRVILPIVRMFVLVRMRVRVGVLVRMRQSPV